MNRLILPVGALALALLIATGALVARAKEPRADQAEAANGVIGSVDLERVYNASGAPQELEQAARQHEAEGANRIKKVMAVPFLEEKELEEFGTLVGKDKLTPEEEKRVAELKGISDKRAGELQTLQTKKDVEVTDADKARMRHLAEMRQILEEQVRPGLITDFRSQQENWVAAYRHQQLQQLREDVAKVAKEKGIAHVFEAGTLIYSVNDLTPQVLVRLTKRGAKH